ncbi:uncharacterized protein MEPE_00134 [Melanopsichium pennsylvanicum]|uniref:Uncharacterized protein n=1 Tax=Melanopsichium pennsylvanicum TaxID=63383 RepID=A0AAJ4XFB9_9BASI|nr:uncharacterized protein MEPE_00134 [Melanopsichium pennsylvanicum]
MPSSSGRRDAARKHRQTHDHDDDNDSVASWDELSTSSSSQSSSSYTSESSEDGIAVKLPTLPDLRFEQSYLATIRNFLHEEQPSTPSHDDSSTAFNEKGEEYHYHKVEITHSKKSNVRDQLLSPLLQGAVWGFAGLLLTQFRQYTAARVKANMDAKVGRARGAKGETTSILRALGLSKR